MKSWVLILFIVLSAPTTGLADTAASVGGGVGYDPAGSPQIQPVADVTLLGSTDWVPTDALSFYLDWNAGGSYEPLVDGFSGLFTVSLDGSYMRNNFLARLSVSSVANPSTIDPFYGAASSDILLSYGGTEHSFFFAPRFSVVLDSNYSMEASGNLGAALLLFNSLLVKPHLELGISVPGGPAGGWRIGPAISGDWYPGGPLTLGMELGYMKSYSTTLSSLVSGGAFLPLDTWDRYSAAFSLSLLVGSGLAASLSLPADYYLLTYEAFDGTTYLGVPTWRLELNPGLEVTVPLSHRADFVLSGAGNMRFSNNLNDRLASFSVGAHFELQLD